MKTQPLQNWQTALKTFISAASPASVQPLAACRLVSLSSDMPSRLRLAMFAIFQRNQQLLVTDGHAAPTLRSYAAALRASSANNHLPPVLALASIPADEWLPRTVWVPAKSARCAPGVQSLLQPATVALRVKTETTGEASSLLFDSPPTLLVAEVWARAVSDGVIGIIEKSLIPKARSLLLVTTTTDSSSASRNEEQLSTNLAPALSSAAFLLSALYSARHHLLFNQEALRKTDVLAFSLLDVIAAKWLSSSSTCALGYCDLAASLAASLRVRCNISGASTPLSGHLLKAINRCTTSATTSATASSLQLDISPTAGAGAPRQAQLLALPIRLVGEWAVATTGTSSSNLKQAHTAFHLLQRCVAVSTGAHRSWVQKRQEHFEERLAQMQADHEAVAASIGESRHDAHLKEKVIKKNEQHLRLTLQRDKETATEMKLELQREQLRSGRLFVKALQASKSSSPTIDEAVKFIEASSSLKLQHPRSGDHNLNAVLPVADAASSSSSSSWTWISREGLQITAPAIASKIVGRKVFALISMKALAFECSKRVGRADPPASLLYLRCLMHSSANHFDAATATSSLTNDHEEVNVAAKSNNTNTIDWWAETHSTPPLSMVVANLSHYSGRRLESKIAPVHKFAVPGGSCRVLSSDSSHVLVRRFGFPFVLEVTFTGTSAASSSSSSSQLLISQRLGCTPDFCFTVEAVTESGDVFTVPDAMERMVEDLS